jgi:hypothetical protein
MDIGRNLSIQVSKSMLRFSPGARIFAYGEVSHDVNNGFITKKKEFNDAFSLTSIHALSIVFPEVFLAIMLNEVSKVLLKDSN